MCQTGGRAIPATRWIWAVGLQVSGPPTKLNFNLPGCPGICVRLCCGGPPNLRRHRGSSETGAFVKLTVEACHERSVVSRSGKPLNKQLSSCASEFNPGLSVAATVSLNSIGGWQDHGLLTLGVEEEPNTPWCCWWSVLWILDVGPESLGWEFCTCAKPGVGLSQ